MNRPFRTVIPLLLVALVAARSEGQELNLSPDAKLKVLDLFFKVEDLGRFKVEDLGGLKVADLGAKVANLQVKETDAEVRIELAADVLFDFDEARLLPKAEETLTKAATLVRERAAGAVRIEGHTDSKGDNAYNQRLSERRAESVRQWFRRHGNGSARFSAKGYGESRPVAPNAKPNGDDDPEGRQKNRRVEIVIAKKR